MGTEPYNGNDDPAVGRPMPDYSASPSDPAEARPGVAAAGPENLAPDAEIDVQADLASLRARLDRLTEGTEPLRDVGLERIAAEASQHAAALHSTLQAQKQAQRLLVAANQIRGEASAQAEQILREAQSAAERLQREAREEADRARQDTAEWSSGRRREIEATLAELTRAAQLDRERLRAEAERTATADADVVARQYVARIREAAERDAERLRGEAQALLDQAHETAADIDQSVRGLSDTIASFLVTSQRQAIRLEELTARATALAVGQVPSSEDTDATDATDATDEDAGTTDENPIEPEAPEQPPAGLPLGSLFGQIVSEE